MGKRKKKEVEGMELESGGMMRWLLTYADMLTLLFALFIILYSMAVVDSTAYAALAEEFRKTFGAAPGSKHMLDSVGGDLQGFAIVPGRGHNQGGGGTPQKVRQSLAGLEAVTLREDERAITVSIEAEGMLFVKGDSELLGGVKRILDPLAKALEGASQAVMVEGHTCDLPVSTSRYPSNWELSTARAASVVKYLVSQGVDPGILAASGYGDTRPVRANSTENNRKHNRRVDVVILKERVAKSNSPWAEAGSSLR